MFAEAVVFLAVSRLLIIWVPLRRLARLLSVRPQSARPRSRVGDAPETAKRVRRAVSLAARHVPWSAVCLPRAMAGKFMLARRGIGSTLHLGAGRSGVSDKLEAHAWLTVEDVVVLGEAGMKDVIQIARF